MPCSENLLMLMNRAATHAVPENTAAIAATPSHAECSRRL